MKIIEKATGKQIYNRLEIVCIVLDNKIALALESTPPIGPDELMMNNNDSPFQNTYT